MRKIWAIAWKEIYTTFTDRSLILIMIATPLAIATIVGLAFGGLGGGDVPVRNIPVAIINRDTGSAFGANYGQIFVMAMVPNAPGTESGQSAAPTCEEVDAGSASGSAQSAAAFNLQDLTTGVAFDATTAQGLVDDGVVTAPDAEPGSDAYVEAVAKAAVDNGKYTALIVIPADFSQKMSYVPVLHPQIEQTGVYVYANSGSPIAASIIRSIVEGITNQIATGNITVVATFGQMSTDYGLGTVGQAAQTLDMATAFTCAFTPAFDTVSLDAQTVTGSAASNSTVIILVAVGSSQAMFFALFTSQFGVLSMHDERRNWTLQRLITTPTPRFAILSGKLVGVFMTVLFQLVVLLIALTLVGSLLQGGFVFIWGTNLLLIAVTLLAIALAVSGLGMLLAGLARTPEQAQTFGPVINIALAVLGGAFGFQLPQAIAGFSMIYWGQNALTQLSNGETDIGLALIVLLAQGVVMFAIGLMLFNRRFEM